MRGVLAERVAGGEHAGDAVLRQAPGRRAVETVRIAGWVCSVSLRVSSGPSKISFESAKPKRRIGLFKDGARGRKALIELSSHANGLRPLPGEQECWLDSGTHRDDGT